MSRLSILILVFSFTFALFFIAPAILNKQIGPHPLMEAGDTLDILTPLMLIPIYRLLYQMNQDKAPSLKESMAFLVFVAFWVEGQGMHLSANSIGHTLKELKGIDAYRLTYFYDEVLSHYLWHFGVVGLSALLIFRQWRNPFNVERAPLLVLSLSGVIHGSTFFLIGVEAGTAPLCWPFAILIALFGLVWGRRRLRQQPVLTFFFITYSLATILFAGWMMYWGGLPELSQVGIID